MHGSSSDSYTRPRPSTLHAQLTTPLPYTADPSPPHLPLQVHDIGDGARIVEAGEVADALFLLLSGEVVCRQPSGTEQRLSAGDVFGESCFSSTPPRREATVLAVGAVQVAKLRVADCKAILGDLAAAIDQSFASKVVDACSLFASLSVEERASLAFELMRHQRSAAPGEDILVEGVAGDAFYIVKHGTVEVSTTSAGAAAPTKLAMLACGGYFGERSLLTAQPTVASVRAIGHVELLYLPKHMFETRLGLPLQAIIDREVGRRDQERIALATPKLLWDDLELKAFLGEGSFGAVRLAVHRPTQRAYALKQLFKGHLVEKGMVENTVREKQIMRMADHPFVLRCDAAYNKPRQVALLIELAPGGELMSRMKQAADNILDESEVALYVATVASALGFLGSRQIVHRDLKPENLLFDAQVQTATMVSRCSHHALTVLFIMLSPCSPHVLHLISTRSPLDFPSIWQGYLKVVDFGLAKLIPKGGRTWTFCGTPDYIAPEVLTQASHAMAVDWWSLGVLAYEMLHGETPFFEDELPMTFDRIVRADFQVPPGNDDAADLIEALLEPNPATRLGVLAGREDGVLSHPFCKHIDRNALLKKELTPPFVPALSNPTDTSNFAHCPEPASGKEFDRFLRDKKYDALWEREFDEGS